MNKNLKTGLSLLIIASVFFMCSTVAFFILKESEKEKRVYIESELEKTVKAKEDIAKDYDEVKIINKDLESKLSSAKEEAKRFSEELAREKAAKEAISSQLDEEKEKSDGLLADIMKEKEERLKLVHKLTSQEESYRELKDQHELMIEAKETLEEKLKGMLTKKGVELERIEVRTGREERHEEKHHYENALDETAAFSEVPEIDEKKEGPPLDKSHEPRKRDGKVLVVNRKFDFIVVNIGRSDGVDIGTALDVYRKEKLIAKTAIEKLYDNMSASTVLPEYRNANIREGDQIRIPQ